MRADHVLAHVLRMGARVADALDALDAVEQAEQFGEAHTVRQVTPVGVDVLPEQRHLAHTVGGHPLDLSHKLARVPAHLSPTRRGDDAVGAGAVASHADLHPSLERAPSARRQMAGEPLELEVALGGQRVARQELRELVNLAWTEGDIDEREAFEHLLLDRLRPAATDAHYALWAPALQPLGLPQVRDEAAVGRLADRARVEQDQVGLLARGRLGIAE